MEENIKVIDSQKTEISAVRSENHEPLRLAASVYMEDDPVARAISFHLDIQEDDVLLDLQCRRGLLTNQLASKVDYVIALDSELSNIEEARSIQVADNIIFLENDLSYLDVNDIRRLYPQSITKIVMHNMMRDMSMFDFEQLIKRLIALTGHNIKMYITDVPLKERRSNLNLSWAERLKSSFGMHSKDTIKRWWNLDDIQAVCDKLALKTILPEISAERDSSLYATDILLYSA